MKHSFRTILLRAVLGMACVSAAQTGFANDTEANQEKLRELKATIEQLKKEIEQTKSNRDELNSALEDNEKRIGELTKKTERIQSQLEDREKKLRKLRDERSNLHQQKVEQEDLVGDYMNAAYRLGQQGNLRLLLNQEDPARVSRNLKYYDYLIRARAEKITSFIATITRINQIEPEIAYEKEQIQQDFNVLRNKRDELRSAQSQRKQTLAKLETKLNSSDQKLRKSMDDRRRLEALLSKVIENIEDIKLDHEAADIRGLKGKLPWPTKGKVIQRFGSQRVAHKMRWEGILIGSNAGEPVSAVHHGRVVFSDYLRGHGLLIIVDHGAGYMSLYAHNQALYKELGEWVNRGDTIASVGNSGGQQDSALYFELRFNGKPTNPQTWLKRA